MLDLAISRHSMYSPVMANIICGIPYCCTSHYGNTVYGISDAL